MWQASFERIYPDVTARAIWAAWADVERWPEWDRELEWTRLEGAFAQGSTFTLKPKGGPSVRIRITACEPERLFTDVARFPLARMTDHHELEAVPGGLAIRSRIDVQGPLAWLWTRLVARDVAAGVPAQMDALVAYARARA